MSQALPLVTVVLGSQTSGQEVTVVTASDDADEPRKVCFNLLGEASQLSPGKPSWANYVKGVIQHYRGEWITSKFYAAMEAFCRRYFHILF